ncbi:MAG TPA: peroxiredoxin [Kiritimatiellia bacterium]|nr:peroxiredoxin [Kiritimatiellia bacterium]HMO99402.1 peroxiredoxin [Kiritimatiellia bacterium]HMP97953.1 peroxiredoxin [Kiritimatiellia bacterium]
MKGYLVRWSMLGLLFSAAPAALAVKVGDPVPDLAVAGTGGSSVNLRNGDGWRVVFFYPKAFTPGCNAQACGMRDSFQAYLDRGVTVFGVSTDSLKTQQEFKEKHNLPYELLADADKELSRAFNVLMPLVGWPKRTTFIINPEGIVTDIIDAVNVGSHDADVLRLLDVRVGETDSGT